VSGDFDGGNGLMLMGAVERDPTCWGLLKDINENPESDDLRLIFADWLEDQEQPGADLLAGVIRLQLAPIVQADELGDVFGRMNEGMHYYHMPVGGVLPPAAGRTAVWWERGLPARVSFFNFELWKWCGAEFVARFTVSWMGVQGAEPGYRDFCWIKSSNPNSAWQRGLVPDYEIPIMVWDRLAGHMRQENAFAKDYPSRDEAVEQLSRALLAGAHDFAVARKLYRWEPGDRPRGVAS